MAHAGGRSNTFPRSMSASARKARQTFSSTCSSPARRVRRVDVSAATHSGRTRRLRVSATPHIDPSRFCARPDPYGIGTSDRAEPIERAGLAALVEPIWTSGRGSDLFRLAILRKRVTRLALVVQADLFDTPTGRCAANRASLVLATTEVRPANTIVAGKEINPPLGPPSRVPGRRI